MSAENERIFFTLWNDPHYIELHAIKDSIKPFSVADVNEQIRRLDAFYAACDAIATYERKMGVK